ncbi:MAG: hypothetical protein ACLQJR_05730 [Stellaceae bacterium]
MTATAAAGRPRGRAHPLSQRTRRRLLSGLRDRALAGDAAAAEVLLKLGQQATGEPAKIQVAGDG